MTLHVLWPAVRWAGNLHIETEGLSPGVTPHFSLGVDQVSDEIWALADGIVGGPDLPDEIIAKMPRCRIHVRPGVGFDTIVIARWGRHGTPESARDMRSISAHVAARYLRDGRLKNCVNEHYLTHRR